MNQEMKTKNLYKSWLVKYFLTQLVGLEKRLEGTSSFFPKQHFELNKNLIQLHCTTFTGQNKYDGYNMPMNIFHLS